MNSKADYNPMPTEIDDNMFLRCNISHLWLEIAIVCSTDYIYAYFKLEMQGEA